MKLGVIGYGARIGKDIIPEILKIDSGCRVTAVTDINKSFAESIMNETGIAHGGGDWELAYNFIQVMQGKAHSVSCLDAGLLSVLMCLKAKESAETKTFQEIKWPDGSGM